MRIALPIRASSRQRGDTIVEVLIVVAICSLVLSGAYVTTNRSLQATRAAQERSTAVEIGESQFELINAHMATSQGYDELMAMANGEKFCMSTTTGQVLDGPNDPNDLSDPNILECLVGTDGLPTSLTAQPSFRLQVISLFPGCFNLVVTWSDVSGRQTDRFQMKYRIFE